MARDWIEMLADLAREQDRAIASDPRLDALVEGTLPDADKEQLERDAVSSVESARMLAAFEPLDMGVKDRLVQSAHTVLTNPPTGERDPLEVSDDLEESPEPQVLPTDVGKPTDRPVATHKAESNTGFVVLLVALFVIAAAVAAYFAWPSGGAVPPTSP